MKGMLIKDFMLLKNQKQFFVTILVFAFVFFGIYDDTTFAFTYIVVLCTLFTISTISYDEYDNGMSFLFTLPCFLQALFGEKCKIFLENVASPNWRKLQSLDRQLFCQP